MANLAIKGHANRGEEVIEILKMLGGRNASACTGAHINTAYVLARYGPIDIIDYINLNSQEYNLNLFTLEEFLEKFPYKVGDKVKTSLHFANCIGTVKRMRWEQNEDVIIYDVEWSDANKSTLTYYAQGLRPYKEQETMDEANKAVFDANAQCCDIMNNLIKEETMEKEEETFGECIEKTIQECLFGKKETMEDIIKIDIPKGYEFAGVDDDNQQVVFEKIEHQYPKTYEECCMIMGFSSNTLKWNNFFSINRDTHPYIKHIDNLIESFCKLLVCRDTYWKIAGEQMGLGKPWEPDYTNDDVKFCICCCSNLVVDGITYDTSEVFVFPTAEMRDAFKENFWVLIELCKELL